LIDEVRDNGIRCTEKMETNMWIKDNVHRGVGWGTMGLGNMDIKVTR
jgi:hypothetical protein